MRAMSFTRTIPPSGVSRDYDISELLRGGKAALSKHGIGELLVAGSGLAANLDRRGFTVLCAWTALTISVTAMPSFANWSGFTQSLMA